MFFAIPGRWQAWPNRAACWSPAIPATGTSPPNSLVVPKTSAEGSGSRQPRRVDPEQVAELRVPVERRMSNSIVREALE